MFGVIFVLLAIGIWYIRSILEPLIIAAFIGYLINPAINYLTRKTKMSRSGAVNLVYFVTLAILIVTPSTLTSLFFDEFTQVASDISNIFNKLITWLLNLSPIPGIPIDFGQLGNKLADFRGTFLSSFSDQALVFLGKTSMGALWVLVILVGVYYFLSEWPRLRNGFIDSFPEAYRPELNELYLRLRTIWMNYLRGQLLLMGIVGVVFTIAWIIIGIPGALVLGVVAGFLTLIPDVGPFLAAMLAIGVTLLEGSNWSWMPSSNLAVAAIVLAVYLVLISIKNFWLRPYIMGRSVHMDEAVVLISIILSTILWGILGALLVVPVLASLVIIFDYLRRRILGMPPFPLKEPFILETPLASPIEKVAAIKSRISKKKG
jgi:predicted PurR-regulated permease PerM